VEELHVTTLVMQFTPSVAIPPFTVTISEFCRLAMVDFFTINVFGIFLVFIVSSPVKKFNIFLL